MKIFVALGSANLFLAVALGAFGAHALKDHLLQLGTLETYQTGVQYHMIHALGLLAVAMLMERWGLTSYLNWSGWLLFAGIILFSGSLYVLSMSGIRWLGAITPFGGVAFLIGWALMFIAALKA
ncbi:DUF423 domain-containing protein [Rubeoparvulum massiliense]|uniref:DUF423 domain-containing protein n=1 Tax=Rubeoparvulum massiliense TaxID=1631346 RepID=UPI00065DE329|nr:DUF423 domain-containing protein [Rubeoparvulum massiliense]